MRHDNVQNCSRCESIFNRYPGFNQELKTWFYAIRVEHPDAHISCAGRGREDQEAAYERNLSRARWGQSAHNWNAAIDVFQLHSNSVAVWQQAWFEKVIQPNLYSALKWYGAKGSSFYELPHIELSNWREMQESGELQLVEPYEPHF